MDYKISSDESEGIFNEFLDHHIDDMIDSVIKNGSIENLGDRGSDLILEFDDIEPPRFVYSPPNGGQAEGQEGPGKNQRKIKVALPFSYIMELIAKRLDLPRLNKPGEGKIKEVTEVFNSFGQLGVILDKKRTFKRALKTSTALKIYEPHKKKWDISIFKRDKRFKLPNIVEKPKYKAVVFYMGDISYSTHGERIQMQKQFVAFIQNWIDYNYGVKNTEHRFFVHDYNAYEVSAADFYDVSNAGGTYVNKVFELVSQIALNEYDPRTTNFYAFYFGDGEVFPDDGREVQSTIKEMMYPYFNRIGIVEVLPSRMSHLIEILKSNFESDDTVILCDVQGKDMIIPCIKRLFGGAGREKHSKSA